VARAGRIAGALGLGSLLGGMLFFAFVLAPLVFTRLPAPVAGPFIRAVFPYYYAYMVACAGLALLGYALCRQRVTVALLAVIILVTLMLWFWLIPHLDMLRQAGDQAGFDRGHQVSVWVDAAQLLAVLWMVVRAAI
jgi:hypothetical protein